MPTAPVIPESAPFTPEQRAWLNGMVAALYGARISQNGTLLNPPNIQTPISNLPPPTPLTILFGSQTGTAETLAKQTAKAAKKHNLTPSLADLADYDPASLTSESHLLLLTSTYGAGEPPDTAQAFYAALHADTAPRLENLTYSVLGLGDTSYPDFNQCAIDLDARLAALGANRLAPSIFCDVDYDADATTWQTTCFTSISNTIKP